MNDLFTPDAMINHAEEIASTAFSRFNHLINNHDINTLFCFVEGHDMSYYSIRVNLISGKNSSFIDSKGKKGVLEVYQLLKTMHEYDKYKKLYFVDRDYDNNAQNDDIYITPGYSVENFYGTIDCYKNLIQGTYHIYEDNPKYQLCIELYNKNLQEFLDATSLFCAWYKCTKSKVRHEVELSDSFPNKYAAYTNNSIQKKNYDLHTLNNDYADVDNVSDIEINESLLYINNDISNIRGKYVLEFIEFLIKFLNNDSKHNKKYTDNKISFDINRKTLIERLSVYASTPKCLESYISRYK